MMRKSDNSIPNNRYIKHRKATEEHSDQSTAGNLEKETLRKTSQQVWSTAEEESVCTTWHKGLSTAWSLPANTHWVRSSSAKRNVLDKMLRKVLAELQSSDLSRSSGKT